MSRGRGGRGRAVCVQLRRSLFAAAAAILLVVGAGGAQAAGGALDPTFGEGGKVLTGFGAGRNDEAFDVEVQTGGKVVVGGITQVVKGSGHDATRGDLHFALAVYTSRGDLDRTFGGDGEVLTDTLTDRPCALVVQTDGKIVIAGSNEGSDFVLARYTPRGKLDRTFGRAGTVVTDVGGSYNGPTTLAIQADGRILAVGAGVPTGVEAGGQPDFALVRYTPSGKLDASFGTGGKVLTDFGRGRYSGPTASADRPSALAVQADGKIVAGGATWTNATGDRLAVARYTTDGKLDASFGRGGKVVGGGMGIGALAVQTDGKIVAVANGTLIRFTTGGKLDASFGSDGKVVGQDALAVAIQADGRIVAAGGDSDFAVARYTSSGKPDPTYGSAGKVLTDFGTERNDTAYALAIQPDGKIVAAGSSSDRAHENSDFAVVRYTK